MKPERINRRQRLGAASDVVVITLAAIACDVGLWLFCLHMQDGAITTDWPWLYRAGQYIWAHGLPSHDLYSWTFPDRPWVLYQWLFEAITAPVYHWLGASASVVLVSLAGVAIYALLPALYLARRGVHPGWTLVLGALALIPVSTNLGLRPMLVSSLALLAQYVIVDRLRGGRLRWPTAWAMIVTLYVVWASMHLGFTLGLISLLLFGLGDAWTHRRGGDALPPRVYLALLASAVTASLVNPYGWRLYPYIVHLSLETRMNAHIHELMPPSPHNLYLVAGGVLLALAAVAAIRARRSLRAADCLHLAVFSALAFMAMRFVVWAGLYYVLVAPGIFQRALRLPRPGSAAGRRGCADYGWIAAFAVLAVFVAAVAAPMHTPARIAGCRAMRGALIHLNTHQPPDIHWFASEKVGSCARLYTPGRRVFIDTRFDIYPESFVLAWFEAYQYRRHWRALFRRWRIRVVLLSRKAPLTPVLAHDPRYRLTYRDADFLIFERPPWPAAAGKQAQDPAH